MYRTYNQFKEGRDWMTSRKVNAFPGYDGSHPVDVGFGNWLHRSKGGGGGQREGKIDMVDFKNNTFTPDEWEYALSYALTVADEYIWVYSVPWATLPDAYRHALAGAKKPHALDFKPLERPEENKVAEYIGTAKGRADALDSVVFAPFYRTHEELFDFPKTWKFSFDPKNLGQKEGWFKPDHSISTWQDLRIDDWWEPQVKHNYFGAAWYRIEFTPPSSWKDRKPLLCFGAVDEDAHVYLNGKLLGAHIYGADGWDTPFELPLDGKLRWNQPNTLVVRVVSVAGLGGIWKSVKIFAPKMSSEH
jgi:Glycosyl hydrolases family 2, sugar binding domain